MSDALTDADRDFCAEDRHVWGLPEAATNLVCLECGAKKRLKKASEQMTEEPENAR